MMKKYFFESITECSQKLNISTTYIYRVLNNKAKNTCEKTKFYTLSLFS